MPQPMPLRDDSVVILACWCGAFQRVRIEQTNNLSQHPAITLAESWLRRHHSSMCAPTVRVSPQPGMPELSRQALQSAGLIVEVEAPKADEPEESNTPEFDQAMSWWAGKLGE